LKERKMMSEYSIENASSRIQDGNSKEKSTSNWNAVFVLEAGRVVIAVPWEVVHNQ
jgi:hypothetical protein